MKILMTHLNNYEPYDNYIKKIFYNVKDVDFIDLPALFRKNMLKNINLLWNHRKDTHIVHIHWFPFNLEQSVIFYFLFKALNYKIIMTVHNVFPHKPSWWHSFMIKRWYSLADELVVHYDSNRKELRKLGIKTKISVISLPQLIKYDFKKWNKTKARKFLKIPYDEKVFLFFGSLRQYKGIEDLILAFKSIPEEKKKNLTLLIVGSKDYMETELHFDDSKIRFIEGFVKDDEVEKFFKCADFVVYPFRQITGSASILPVYEFKKQFISTKTGGIPEEVKKYGGGILIKPGDTAALKRAMLSIIGKKVKVKKRDVTVQNFARSYYLEYKRLVEQ